MKCVSKCDLFGRLWSFLAQKEPKQKFIVFYESKSQIVLLEAVVFLICGACSVKSIGLPGSVNSPATEKKDLISAARLSAFNRIRTLKQINLHSLEERWRSLQTRSGQQKVEKHSELIEAICLDLRRIPPSCFASASFAYPQD